MEKKVREIKISPKSTYVYLLSIPENQMLEAVKRKYMAKGLPVKLLAEIEQDVLGLFFEISYSRNYYNLVHKQEMSILDSLDRKYYLKLKLIDFKIKVFLFFRRIYKKLSKIKNKFILGNRLNDESKGISFIKLIGSKFRL